MSNKPHPTTMDAIFDEEMAKVRTEAQKAAWQYENINDACPYPFGSDAGKEFKKAFLTAQAIQAAVLSRNAGGAA